ncbi:zinc-ribbon domain containing protein [Candidatus Gottesmanbacteria bacterium]|nr:zinc-ribbon domain containing protein [Candidatus Gottesmanbacteria bacterium]
MSDITQTCTKCGKQFLIIVQEQEFLQKKGLSFPTLCPADRQVRRLANRGERMLYKTTCSQCGNRVITSYDPAKATSPILCKTCYVNYFETHDPLQT